MVQCRWKIAHTNSLPQNLIPFLLETAHQLILYYCNLPNKGAGRSSKIRSDRLGKKLRVSAFKRWFQIENRINIKETTSILAIYDNIGSLQTRGALIRGGTLNWQNMVRASIVLWICLDDNIYLLHRFIGLSIV